MTDPKSQDSSDRYGGDRRAKDRRKSDRRGDSRRAPPPPWRRPSAFVAYGVVATLILVILFTGGDDEVDEFPGETETTAAVRPSAVPVPREGAGIRQAFTQAEFERLVAEGNAAVGEVVQAELYCGSIVPMALRQIDGIDPTLTDLADAEGRVPAAECRWSREAGASDFLLVVPSELAADFAAGPEVELNFVRRRRVPADVYWLGRSEGLALRMAGILIDVRSAR